MHAQKVYDVAQELLGAPHVGLAGWQRQGLAYMLPCSHDQAWHMHLHTGNVAAGACRSVPPWTTVHVAGFSSFACAPALLVRHCSCEACGRAAVLVSGGQAYSLSQSGLSLQERWIVGDWWRGITAAGWDYCCDLCSGACCILLVKGSRGCHKGGHTCCCGVCITYVARKACNLSGDAQLILAHTEG